MEVAIYCDCNSRGGVLTYTVGLGRALVKLGVEVTIVSHYPASKTERELCDQMEGSATRLTLLPLCETVPVDAKRLAQAVAGSQIYLPNYRLAPHVAAAMLAGTGIQSIGICHTDHRVMLDSLARYSDVLSRFVCAVPSATVGLIDRLPHRRKDVHVIAHGVRIPEACTPFTGGPIKIVYHGRLCEDQKQASMLLHIADQLVATGVPFSMRLIGDGGGFEAYRTRIQDGLNHVVSIEPGMPWERLSEILQESHLTLLTSAHEGFCFSLAEAMGAGLPGVAFRLGGVIEDYLIHGENGILVEQGDVKGAAAAIGRLQANPSEWTALSVNARQKIAERFSWDSTACEYARLFEAALRHPHRARWPLLRPLWIPETPGKSLRSAIERVGRASGVWG